MRLPDESQRFYGSDYLDAPKEPTFVVDNRSCQSPSGKFATTREPFRTPLTPRFHASSFRRTCNQQVTLALKRHSSGCDFNRPENEKTAEFRGFGRFGDLERAKGFEPSTPTLASEKLRRHRSLKRCTPVPPSVQEDAVFGVPP